MQSWRHADIAAKGSIHSLRIRGRFLFYNDVEGFWDLGHRGGDCGFWFLDGNRLGGGRLSEICLELPAFGREGLGEGGWGH